MRPVKRCAAVHPGRGNKRTFPKAPRQAAPALPRRRRAARPSLRSRCPGTATGETAPPCARPGAEARTGGEPRSQRVAGREPCWPATGGGPGKRPRAGSPRGAAWGGSCPGGGVRTGPSPSLWLPPGLLPGRGCTCGLPCQVCTADPPRAGLVPQSVGLNKASRIPVYIPNLLIIPDGTDVNLFYSTLKPHFANSFN